MRQILVMVCAFALAGCGAAKVDPRTDARAEYQKSLDDYQACINSNLQNLQKCEENRVLMETNGRTYSNVVAGIKQRTAATTQGSSASGDAQSANAANTTQATSSQLPARIAPPQPSPSQMPAPTSPAPQITLSLPAQIPPPRQETLIEDHPGPVDARLTPAPIPF